MAGLQCHLRLWYQCYARDLAPEISPSQGAVFDTGHEVGRLATRIYPGGVLIEEDYLHHEEAVASTIKVMQNSAVKAINKAVFLYNDVRILLSLPIANLDCQPLFMYHDLSNRSVVRSF